MANHKEENKTESEIRDEEHKRESESAKERLLREKRELYAIPKHLDVDKLN